MSERQSHWERVYTSKNENEVSWFQAKPETSLDLIRQSGATSGSAIIDIGGGASRLVDTLLRAGFRSLAVLDLTDAALAVAGARLGAAASRVDWIVADVTQWKPARDTTSGTTARHFIFSRIRRTAPPISHVFVTR